MVAPGSWLHGASVRGSAAAPVSEPTVLVLIAPQGPPRARAAYDGPADRWRPQFSDPRTESHHDGDRNCSCFLPACPFRGLLLPKWNLFFDHPQLFRGWGSDYPPLQDWLARKFGFSQ